MNSDSTALEPSKKAAPSVADTCAQIIREKIPNFFRLHLNPYVVQTCFCLTRSVQRAWPAPGTEPEEYQTFLANSFDEAVSGAIKLARYCANQQGRPATGLVLDPAGRLGPIHSLAVKEQRRALIPDLVVVEGDDLSALGRDNLRIGFLLLVPPPGRPLPPGTDALQSLIQRCSPTIITCVDRANLAEVRQGGAGLLSEMRPDIVVFDESFVNHEVPLGAFTARKALYHHWTQRGKSTFHSTTFQPNTIVSLHYLRCLQQQDPAFHAELAGDLARIESDPSFCLSQLARLYSPFLAGALRKVGLDTPAVQAEGHYIRANGQRIFDGVAGVACSIRGHNPPTYVEELARQPEVADWHALAEARLHERTGLEHLLPAVSGAAAVENALKLALAAQFPRKLVVAFKGGFGGKTLLALTGTARSSYKEYLEPLYDNVLYLDPFAPTVLQDLEQTFARHPVAVVQLELIQAVGGVRSLPCEVVQHVAEQRRKWGYLLFVDEVQTGMYRTGTFTLSEQLGIRPDLMSIGKGTSDMMFPFALTLYSDRVRELLDQAQPSLPETLRKRQAHDWGYKTVLNVLDQAEAHDLPANVRAAGELFSRQLSEELAACKVVREVRAHGLLIAIEIDTRARPRKWLKKWVSWLYLLNMLRHRTFPLFVGFCQYEPNVLKLTPPLTITTDEVRQVCATLASVLKTPLSRLVTTALGALAAAAFRRPRQKTFERS